MTKKWYANKYIVKFWNRIYEKKFAKSLKERDEWSHWVGQALQKENNDHFKYFYTDEFGLEITYFTNKKLLDIGCGPTGSLEWAIHSKERYGIDPLADAYLKLGASKHKMKYIKCGAENIPFQDEYFDVIFSFNSLDHVDDLDKSVNEIRRVLKPGGDFLLISDCNHGARITEPSPLPLNFVQKYFFDYIVLQEKHFKNTKLRNYDSLIQARLEIISPEANEPTILKAHLKKPGENSFNS